MFEVLVSYIVYRMKFNKTRRSSRWSDQNYNEGLRVRVIGTRGGGGLGNGGFRGGDLGVILGGGSRDG